MEQENVIAAELLAALEQLTGLMESAMLVNHPDLCSERRKENADAYARAIAAIEKARA